MEYADKRVRQIAYQLALGVNQLVDKGRTENVDTIINKMLNDELVPYILETYKDDSIQEFEFSPLSKERLPDFNILLNNYSSVLPIKYFDYYGVKSNGLVLISSVLLHILKD